MKMTMMMMTTRTTIKSKKQEPVKLPTPSLSTLTPCLRHVSPLALSPRVGKDCTGWVVRVELPAPDGTESHSQGSQAAHHSAFHNFTVNAPFMYTCVRTLGLVSSFGSVLLIFCWMNSEFIFYVVGFIISSPSSFVVLFSVPYPPPYKIIAIAAVWWASYDFVAACCTNQGCSYIFTSCMTKLLCK